MNKGELVDAISVRSEASKQEIESVLTATLDVIKTTVANGQKVSILGFGAFEPRQRAAHSSKPESCPTRVVKPIEKEKK